MVLATVVSVQRSLLIKLQLINYQPQLVHPQLPVFPVNNLYVFNVEESVSFRGTQISSVYSRPYATRRTQRESKWFRHVYSNHELP